MKIRCTPRAGEDEARGEAQAVRKAAGKASERQSCSHSQQLAVLLSRLDRMEHRLDAMLSLLSQC